MQLRRARPVRIPAVAGVLLGIFLIQLAWVAAVPPFRGSDEFDHVFRADSVAHGDWGPALVPPDEGRGGLVVARESLVNAASTMCFSYEYTSAANCLPIERFGDGRVSVATGAFAYHPVYYWIVGSPALLAEGADALLVMRLVSAVLCSLMLGIAFWTLGLAHRSILPRIGLLVGTTPVFLYSTSVVAPNGLEMATGAAVWAGFLALSLRGPDLPHSSRVIAVTAACAVVLVSLRQLGPLWLLLIVGSCALLGGLGPWRRLLRAYPIRITASIVAVGLATLGAYLWVTSTRSLSLPAALEEYPRPIRTALSQPPLWLLQSIGAFPLRDEPAPLIVYAIYVLVGLVILAVALKRAQRRTRLVLCLTILLSFVLPLLLTLATIETWGKTWQGRYGMAFSVGIWILAGWALARQARPSVRQLVCAGGLMLALAVAHAASTVGVFTKELRNDAALHDAWWPVVPGWVIGALTVIGLSLAVVSLISDAMGPEEAEPGPARLADTESEARLAVRS